MTFYGILSGGFIFFVTAIMILPFSSKNLGTDGLMHKNK